MSAFKFACPVCSQHITCDSESSGSQMNCPTCFRKLIVPQAPASGSQNFVLTATEVPNRPVTTVGSGNGSPATVAPKSGRFSIVLTTFAVICLLGIAVAVVWMGNRMLHRTASDETNNPRPPAHAAQTNKPAPSLPATPAGTTNWTLNLAAAKIPESPVAGTVNGFDFKLERATIQGGKLDLRQGSQWPPDVGVSIHLFADRAEDLAGRSVVLESTRTNAPRVILRWKNAEAKPIAKDFRKGYAARVEFGPVTNNRLAGKIYLATPDDAKSFAAGTFVAEIRKPAPPKK